LKRFKKPKGDEGDPQDAAPDQRSGVNQGGSRPELVGYDRPDRTGMRQLIESKAGSR
jgi:hypothetical protein